MPSPSGIFKGLFTASQLQAMLVELATNGMITSLSGGGKSGQFSRIDPMQLGIELRSELNRIGGVVPASKVYQDFRTNNLDAF